MKLVSYFQNFDIIDRIFTLLLKVADIVEKIFLCTIFNIKMFKYKNSKNMGNGLLYIFITQKLALTYSIFK